MTTLMSRLGALLIITTLVATVAQPAAAATDEFRFEGSGWGHGVGMSQYGAQGQALEGRDATQIVTHYYSGSAVQSVDALPSTWMDSDSMPLWVGLDQSDTTMSFSAVGGTATACQSTIEPCPADVSHLVNAGESWSFRVESTGVCRFYRGEEPAGLPGSCSAAVRWDGASGTRLALPSEADEYAWGDLMFRSPDGTDFHTILRIGVEDFLKGIAEAILSWQSEALKAQVLASRSHAIYSALYDGPETSFSDSLKDNCWCHLRAGVDQAFHGWEIESYPSGYGQRWVDAVAGTDGLVITHPDAASTENSVILALYSSSSGGMTAANQDVWSGVPLPYLQTVTDPWSLGSQNPRASWHTYRSTSTVSSWTGLDQVERIYVQSRFPSGSADIVRFDGYDNGVWKQVTKTGQQVRYGLGLYSTWFDGCRERGPFTDDDCSYFESNIVNIANAGFTDGYGNGTYGPVDAMTRASMAEFLARGLDLPGATIDYFSDDDGIREEAWINSLAAAGITVGFEDGTYRPASTVTRAQMAVYLARAMGSFDPPIPSSDPFSDVPRASWFGPSVGFIADAGVTVGYENGTYGPTNGTARGEMAAFLDRALLGGN